MRTAGRERHPRPEPSRPTPAGRHRRLRRDVRRRAGPVTLSATDPDGDPLTWLPVPVVAPTSGTLSGTPPALVYTPKAGFVGTDLFAFQVSDGLGGTDVAQRRP